MLLQVFSLPLKNPVLIFSLILFIILLTPVLLQRLRIPDLIGLIIAAAYSVAGNIFLTGSLHFDAIGMFFAECIDYKAVIIFILLFGLSRWKKMSPILIILAAGGMGLIFYGLVPAF